MTEEEEKEGWREAWDRGLAVARKAKEKGWSLEGALAVYEEKLEQCRHIDPNGDETVIAFILLLREEIREQWENW